MSDVNISAPVLTLALTCINENTTSQSILRLLCDTTDIANKTSEFILSGNVGEVTVGENIVITGVASPYTGFNGTWEVVALLMYGSFPDNSVVVTINYNYGSLLKASVVAGTATWEIVGFGVLVTTNPNAPTLKLAFGSNSTVAKGSAIAPTLTTGFTFAVGFPFVRTQASFSSDTQYRRWATVAYNRQVFFTNDLNPIAFTDGSAIFRYSNTQPCARYMDVFFDHLVLGYPTWNSSPSPTRVQWSDLYRLNQWHPSPKNEADSYDVEEWCRPDFPLYGCTGLGRIGNTMWVYTPTAIVSMRYQGRLKSPVFNQSLTGATAGGGGPIMVLGDRVLKDVGNSLMYGLVVYKDMHYFWDGVEQDFYRFNGEQVESIGIKIKQYFLSTINPRWSLFQATWGYARPGRQEIVWVFVSAAQNNSLIFDKAIVFNWKTGRWYTQSVEDVHSFNGPSLRSDRAEDLTKTALDLPATADGLGVPIINTPTSPMWGYSGGILRESVDADPDSVLLGQDPPTLVTKDFGYDDLEHFKEASSVVIHATDKYQNGVNVSLSVRDNIDDPVTYPTTNLYPYAPEEKRLGLPRSAGRLLRYRFQPDTSKGPVRGFTWGGFVENVKRKMVDD